MQSVSCPTSLDRKSSHGEHTEIEVKPFHTKCKHTKQETPSIPAVSIILPVYNERSIIDHVFKRVTLFAMQHPAWEFIFVDDGSSDGTASRLRELISEEKRLTSITALCFDNNKGKGQAIHAGLLDSKADLVCFTDGDLAYTLDQLENLVAALDDADIVIGSRALVGRPQRSIDTSRRIAGEAFNLIVRSLLGMRFRDTQAGLKGFHRKQGELLFDQLRMGGFVFDVEFLFLAVRSKMRIVEIPAKVSVRHSYHNSSIHLLRDSFRMLLAVIFIRFNSLTGRYAKLHHADI